MIFDASAPAFPAWRIPMALAYRRDEDEVAAELVSEATLPEGALKNIAARASTLVAAVRRNRASKGGVDALMNEYDLSTQEGLVLMCLAEALLRVPDGETADRLIRDKLTGTDWEKHLGNSRSIFVNASTIGLMMTGRVLGPTDLPADAPTGTLRRLISRLGEPVIRKALQQAMGIMGRQFVLGRTIKEAQTRGAAMEEKGYRYSFDMLGEAARTEADAEAYFVSYETAIHAIGKASAGRGPVKGPGISVKLSALHSRYEQARRVEVLDVLVARTLALAKIAKSYDIGFCIDAEESERLELSLEVLEAVYADPALDGWEGFGLAVQAYQKRTREVIDALAGMVDRVGRRMNVRLVKGAYWDTEIKRAQELGMTDYPLYTRKGTTDVSYLACAQRLFDYGDRFFPQFATHNAHTASAVLEISAGRPFEFQRLHGMGEELYDEIVPTTKLGIPCRIYAPVGGHAELLSYLVRRLLENGANTSFVNRLVDDRTPIDDIIADPVERLAALPAKRHPHIALPRDLYGAERANSRGIDLSDTVVLEALASTMETASSQPRSAGPIIGGDQRTTGPAIDICNPARRQDVVGTLHEADAQDVDDALTRASGAWQGWANLPAEDRACALEAAADAMEAQMADLMALCIREAGKTLPDAVAEIREAIDFLRYYANRARQDFAAVLELPDAKGGAAQVHLAGRGVFVCISPWNFPLAIFTGQVAAALVAGNAVIAKPAEQTPLIAAAAVRIFHAAGVPVDVLHLLPGQGETVGARLTADPRVSGVAFTGSVEVAHIINRALVKRPGSPVPLIAETGGMNCMIVDSSALPEQVVRDVLISAFGSAGQRCSALRVLYVQDDVADHIISMIKGAMNTLTVGDPSFLSTDIGPVIDEDARRMLNDHAARMDREAKATLHVCALPEGTDQGTFFAPRAYEIEGVHVLEREVFGPVLHVVRFKADATDAVVAAVKATGFGLTMGIHTRIDARARAIQAHSQIGNTYVNRNMIGAVVGVQPFGGEGLSGTGPKAGGPHYVHRFAQVVADSIDDAGLVDQVRAVQREAAKRFPADLPPCPVAATSVTLNHALTTAQTAAPTWARTTATSRAAMLDDAARRLTAEAANLAALLARDGATDDLTAAGSVVAAERACAALATQIQHDMTGPTVLPGPTGEYNELQLHGRGLTVAACGAGGSFATLVAQTVAAVGSGNTVVVLADTSVAAAASSLRDLLIAAGIAADALTVLCAPAALIERAATDSRVKAIAFDGSAEALRGLATAIAGRNGAIIPLIAEPMGPGYLDRFVVERTLTIDMTAAGGNASLLTLNEDAA